MLVAAAPSDHSGNGRPATVAEWVVAKSYSAAASGEVVCTSSSAFGAALISRPGLGSES